MDIEKKALELVNEVALRGVSDLSSCYHHELEKALRRAIEQHEAFKRKVSATLIDEYGEEFCRDHSRFASFIIAKPDPLHECLEEALARTGEDLTEHTERLRAALAARGLEIVKKEPSQ